MKTLNFFALHLTLRVGLLLGLCFAAGYVLFDPERIFTQVILLAAIFLLTADIWRLIHRTNEKVNRFIGMLKYHEHNTALDTTLRGAGFRKLFAEMQQIKAEYEQQDRRSKTSQLVLAEIMDAQPIGILAFDNEGKILVQNRRFSSLLELPPLADISRIEALLPGFHERMNALPDTQKFTLTPEEFDYRFGEELICTIFRSQVNGMPLTVIFAEPASSGSDQRDSQAWLSFVKVISHEIMNGITPVLSISQSLLDMAPRLDDPEIRHTFEKGLNTIASQSFALGRFASDYRRLIQLPEPKKEPLSWQQLLTEIIAMSGLSPAIRITVQGDARDQIFRGDKSQLTQVFHNMLLNSRNALGGIPDPEVVFDISLRSSAFVILVRDNGRGIDPQNYGNVFVPFFSTSPEGSGIGLSVARQILWKHGARIHINPQVSEGTEFIIRFPV